MRLVGWDEAKMVEVANLLRDTLMGAGYTVEVAAEYPEQVILGVSGQGMEAGLSIDITTTT